MKPADKAKQEAAARETSPREAREKDRHQDHGPDGGGSPDTTKKGMARLPLIKKPPVKR